MRTVLVILTAFHLDLFQAWPLPYTPGRPIFGPEPDRDLSYQLPFDPVRTRKIDKMRFSLHVFQFVRTGQDHGVQINKWFQLQNVGQSVCHGNQLNFKVVGLMNKIRDNVGRNVEYATIRLKVEDRSDATRPRTYVSEYINIDYHAVESIPQLVGSNSQPKVWDQADVQRAKRPPIATKRPTTSRPTLSPTQSPTEWPTKSPTKMPTKTPTKTPTEWPSRFPTKSPSNRPTTSRPTVRPTRSPTNASPTRFPSHSPATKPTPIPTKYPTVSPTKGISASPAVHTITLKPTGFPIAFSKSPSRRPTASPVMTSSVRGQNASVQDMFDGKSRGIDLSIDPSASLIQN